MGGRGSRVSIEDSCAASPVSPVDQGLDYRWTNLFCVVDAATQEDPCGPVEAVPSY